MHGFQNKKRNDLLELLKTDENSGLTDNQVEKAR